jgi:hypothetical protein
MSTCITALVTIRYQWVRVASLERLLTHLADNRNPALTGTIVLPVTRYDTSDSAFMELVFSNPGLQLEGTLFVPKGEVISILKTANPDDLPKVGYQGRSMSHCVAPEPSAYITSNVAVDAPPVEQLPA